ncbi:MAG: hypothetical protein AAF726_10105 [Planctomycetota bacterium]
MRAALSALLLAPLLAASDVPRVTIDEGSTVTKTFVNELRLELVEIGIELDGEEQDPPSDGLPEVTIADDERIVFVDEYVSVADGRATELIRTFETLEDTSTQAQRFPDGEGSEQSSEGESELEGKSVVFEWDDDDESYDVSFAEDEDGDDDLLEGLEGDADFLFLLQPEDDVEVGDSWSVDGELFTRISSPGGNLKILSEGDDEEFSEQFADGLVGDLEMTLESIEDGVAVVSIEGQVDTEIEVDVETPDAPEGFEASQTFSFSFDIEGKLEWDLESGVASSMELDAEVEMELLSTNSMGETSLVQRQTYEGTFESRVTFE